MFHEYDILYNIYNLFQSFWTVIMNASKYGQIEIVKLYLKQEGFDINFKGVY